MSKRDDIHNIIQEKEELIRIVNENVWEFAELGFKEFKSAELYLELLEREGFNV